MRRVNRTSSVVTLLPSWKRASALMGIVQVRPSSLTSGSARASSGTGCMVSSSR
jgi:hypothetical protein